jgi:H+/Cl- antiporter ClcA
MKGKITGFLREYIFILSIITLLIGAIILIIGILGVWFQDDIKNIMNFMDNIIPWSPYILIIGLIILAAGLYYLYMFISKKNFIIKEIETNKRSEFIKLHAELKNSVKYLPSKYKEMLRQKEKELKIK